MNTNTLDILFSGEPRRQGACSGHVIEKSQDVTSLHSIHLRQTSTNAWQCLQDRNIRVPEP
eukprot:9499099-Karenia_brevis.AAC.1